MSQSNGTSRLTLRTLANRINAHLKRIERRGTTDFKNAGCYYMGGAQVRITYRSREGGELMSREKAMRYLEYLEGGFEGRHTSVVEPNRFASTQLLDG